MMQKVNVIFVCTGNTCRSPMAEGLFKDKAEKDGHGDSFSVCSRGIACYDGDHVSEKSVEVMKELGIDISDHVSHALTPEDIANADYIVCMSEGHKNMIVSYMMQSDDEKCEKVMTFPFDVTDPFGAPVEVYRQCRDMIKNGCDWLYEYIAQNTRNDV